MLYYTHNPYGFGDITQHVDNTQHCKDEPRSSGATAGRGDLSGPRDRFGPRDLFGPKTPIHTQTENRTMTPDDAQPPQQRGCPKPNLQIKAAKEVHDEDTISDEDTITTISSSSSSKKRRRAPRKHKKNQSVDVCSTTGPAPAVCMDHLKGLCRQKRWHCKFVHSCLPLVGPKETEICVGYVFGGVACGQQGCSGHHPIARWGVEETGFEGSVAQICRLLQRVHDESSLESLWPQIITLGLEIQIGALHLLYLVLGVAMRGPNASSSIIGKMGKLIHRLVGDGERGMLELFVGRVLEDIVTLNAASCHAERLRGAHVATCLAQHGVLGSQWVPTAIGICEARLQQQQNVQVSSSQEAEVLCVLYKFNLFLSTRGSAALTW